MDEKGIKQWPDWYPNKDIILDDITKNQLIVAEHNDHIVGMLALSPEVPKEYDEITWKFNKGKATSVHRLATHPLLKTEGLGAALMSYAENEAKNEAYNFIRLDTYSLNSIANKFYRKIGYHYSGDINLQYMPEIYFCFEKEL